MHLGAALGTACSTFAITNIDDLFVLATFFAEATSSSSSLSPWKITAGQYLGFTVIVLISMIGYGLSFALPSEPIGFLGLLPILLGVWKMLDVIFDDGDDEEDGKMRSLKNVLKVASITVMNGGDNIGTYIPLFSQAKGAEIAVYIVVYYILIGVWCFVAWLVMGQKRILRLVEKYMMWVIPLLYVGLGIYITVNSHAFPWAVEKINDRFLGNPGSLILGTVTAGTLALGIGAMVWLKMRKRARKMREEQDVEIQASGECREEAVGDQQVGSAMNETQEMSDTAQTPETKEEVKVVEQEV